MDVRSNKKQIKDAVQRLYDIHTQKINTLIRWECGVLWVSRYHGSVQGSRPVAAGRRQMVWTQLRGSRAAGFGSWELCQYQLLSLYRAGLMEQRRHTSG